jgi:hypothetical protein
VNVHKALARASPGEELPEIEVVLKSYQQRLGQIKFPAWLEGTMGDDNGKPCAVLEKLRATEAAMDSHFLCCVT